MTDLQDGCVEHLAGGLDPPSGSESWFDVLGLSHEGTAPQLRLQADLVAPPALQRDLDLAREAIVFGEDPCLGARPTRAAGRLLPDDLFPMASVPGHPVHPHPGVGNSPDERLVSAERSAFPELVAEIVCAGRVPGEQHDARGVPVDAVDDVRGLALMGEPFMESFPDRVPFTGLLAGRRVGEHPGRFVDGDDVVVLVEDRQSGVFEDSLGLCAVPVRAARSPFHRQHCPGPHGLGSTQWVCV